MKYQKPRHTILQALTAKAKRAHNWAKITPLHEFLPRQAIIKHIGTAY